MGFVWVGAAGKVPGCAFTPALRKLLDDPLHGFSIFFSRAEVEGFGKRRTFNIKILGKSQIAAQGLEHMLPRACGVGIADVDTLAIFNSAQDVWNEPVFSPVAATDDVASPSRCQSNLMLARFSCVEERAAIGCGTNSAQPLLLLYGS